MQGFVVRTLITMAGLWLAQRYVSGVHISGLPSFLIAALLLGVVNALIRPLFIVLTFPFTVVTLGLFLFVVNAFMLWLVAGFMTSFQLAGFAPAFFASLMISFTSWLGSSFVGPKGRVEVIEVRRMRRRR